MISYESLWRKLESIYGAGEAKALVRYVLEVKYGFTATDIYCGKITQLSAEACKELQKITERLMNSEPVQYILGSADFYGRTFRVRPGVLIPRPETEELCRWIIDSNRSVENQQVLDLCTGSGCIAITLALELTGTTTTAWDIASEALTTAQENAKLLGANVKVEKQDVLLLNQKQSAKPQTARDRQWDLIVSNPPYICEKEKADMHKNVLDFEPAIALFVPDLEPLRFYTAIADYAFHALKTNGWLYFEINPLYASDLQQQLEASGFAHVETQKDQYGKTRFIRAQKCE